MIKKGLAIFLSLLVLFITVLSILAIWEVIDIENVFAKSFKTLCVIFVSSTVVLFIFSLLYRDDRKVGE